MTALLLDLDGVVITYERNFAETYSAEFGIPLADIYAFFAVDYPACAVGESNLTEALQNYIPAWKWPSNAESLVKYWFDCQSTVDTALLDLVRAARRDGIKCYVASDQDALRSSYVRGLLDFDAVFDGYFFSCDVGATKADASFFGHILDSLNCQPGELWFWDDNPQNVAVAESVGIHAEVYRGYEAFRQMFSERFGDSLDRAG